MVTFRAPKLPEQKRKHTVLLTEEYRHRWGDSTKMELKREVGWESVRCIHLGSEWNKRWFFVNTIIKFRTPKNEGSFLTS
jgi:hypothetical protein